MSRTKAEFTKPLIGNGAWAQYASNKRERLNYTLRFDCEGNCFYFKDGETLTEAEFNSRFPIGLINRSLHTNLDSRKNLY
jgi:hypothetical protein